MFPALIVLAATLTPDPLVVEGRILRAQKPPPFTLRLPPNPTVAEMRQYSQAFKTYNEAVLKHTDDLLEFSARYRARSKARLKELQEQADREKQEKADAEKATKPKP